MVALQNTGECETISFFPHIYLLVHGVGCKLFVILPFLMDSGRIFVEFPVTLSLSSLMYFLDVGIFSRLSIRVSSGSGDVGFRSSGEQNNIRSEQLPKTLSSRRV